MKQPGSSPYRRMACRATIALGATLAATAATASVEVGPSSPFVASVGGVWTGVGAPIIAEVPVSDAIGPVFVEFGDHETAYGKFRAAFGSNGFAVDGVGGVDREVDGGSLWSDGFTITGGTGSGLLTVSAHVSGTVTGFGQMNFALFVSDQPYNFDTLLSTINANKSGFWALALPDSTRVLYTAVANGCSTAIHNRECGHAPLEDVSGPIDLTLTAEVPFTYGQPLYVVSGFSGGVLTPGGSASFLDSADFGITAPAGAVVSSASGNFYAAAVPEPSVALLLAIGLSAGAALGLHRPARSRAGAAVNQGTRSAAGNGRQ
jgi:hypothetical protein